MSFGGQDCSAAQTPATEVNCQAGERKRRIDLGYEGPNGGLSSAFWVLDGVKGVLKCPNRRGVVEHALLDLLAGCTPPPINEIKEAATLSTGREPVGFGTIVGWSSATKQRSNCSRSLLMIANACMKLDS